MCEPVRIEPGSEPITGYRLISRLGRGGFGEVWKALGPGGFEVALKFVELDDRRADVEDRALEVVRSVRHSCLLATFGAWKIDKYLIVALELADGTLADRLTAAMASGLPGIPRDELLEYVGEAAKGLDHLNAPTHTIAGKSGVSVQHRDIKPQNILLVGGSVKISDFGLARLLEKSAASHSGSMTVAYAPPEFLKGQTSTASDQYSLAVTYVELRTGLLPHSADTLQRLMLKVLQDPPDLSMLSECERPAVLRALDKDPKLRWPSCRGFVEALRAAGASASAFAAAATVYPQTDERANRARPEHYDEVPVLEIIEAGADNGEGHFQGRQAQTPGGRTVAPAVDPVKPNAVSLRQSLLADSYNRLIRREYLATRTVDLEMKDQSLLRWRVIRANMGRCVVRHTLLMTALGTMVMLPSIGLDSYMRDQQSTITSSIVTGLLVSMFLSLILEGVFAFLVAWLVGGVVSSFRRGSLRRMVVGSLGILSIVPTIAMTLLVLLPRSDGDQQPKQALPGPTTTFITYGIAALAACLAAYLTCWSTRQLASTRDWATLGLLPESYPLTNYPLACQELLAHSESANVSD